MNQDLLLLSKITSRDKKALSDLYDKYVHYLYNLIHRYITEVHRIEKVIRQLFNCIWKAPQSFSESKPFSKTLTIFCLKIIQTEKAFSPFNN